MALFPSELTSEVKCSLIDQYGKKKSIQAHPILTQAMFYTKANGQRKKALQNVHMTILLVSSRTKSLVGGLKFVYDINLNLNSP